MTEPAKAFCNQCARETNHEVLYLHRHKYRDKELEELLREEDMPDPEAWYSVLTEMLTCRGCDSVSVRQRTWMGEEERSEKDLIREFGKDDLENYLTNVYYPPVSARRKPGWMSPNSRKNHEIPDSVKELMEEIYIALQNGSRRLVAMGTRAVLEAIMVSATGDHGSFKRNLLEFQKAGYLSFRDSQVVDLIYDAGSANIHRNWKPTDSDVSALMDITESVIETTYLHEPLARGLETSVPRQRPPRRSSEGPAQPMEPNGDPDPPEPS